MTGRFDSVKTPLSSQTHLRIVLICSQVSLRTCFGLALFCLTEIEKLTLKFIVYKEKMLDLPSSRGKLFSLKNGLSTYPGCPRTCCVYRLALSSQSAGAKCLYLLSARTKCRCHHAWLRIKILPAFGNWWFVRRQKTLATKEKKVEKDDLLRFKNTVLYQAPLKALGP